MTTKLSLSNLSSLPAAVGRPRYDRASLSPGILHFGVGNFHRAHQAVYLDDLFNTGAGHDWGIVGAGVFEAERAGRGKLAGQDWLTTVVEQDEQGRSARVTGAMIDFVEPADTSATIARLADPRIRIVSLTITEGGYFIDPASGRFDPAHPGIVADAQDVDNPKTVFGLILAGLLRRRQDGIAPFTVMSCDNIPHNGRVTDALLTLTENETAARWYDECLGRAMDLSAVNWIFLANSLASLSGPLRSRLGVIEVPRPKASHFPLILAGMLRDMAAELGVSVDDLPQLHPEAADYLQRQFGLGVSMRQIRSAVARALAVEQPQDAVEH